MLQLLRLLLVLLLSLLLSRLTRILFRQLLMFLVLLLLEFLPILGLLLVFLVLFRVSRFSSSGAFDGRQIFRMACNVGARSRSNARRAVVRRKLLLGVIAGSPRMFSLGG